MAFVEVYGRYKGKEIAPELYQPHLHHSQSHTKR